jgi:hypothetical protein
MAIQCLKQLADDEGHRFLRASSVLQRDFCIDNALSGSDRKNNALLLKAELTDILKLAGLNISKWASNDQELIQGLSEQDTNQKLQLGESQTLKTLDIFWNSSYDSTLYLVKARPNISRVNK